MAAVVLTLDEVAVYLKVHLSTVYRLLKNRSIPAFKMGSDWRFNPNGGSRTARLNKIASSNAGFCRILMNSRSHYPPAAPHPPVASSPAIESRRRRVSSI